MDGSRIDSKRGIMNGVDKTGRGSDAVITNGRREAVTKGETALRKGERSKSERSGTGRSW